jgi:hypothetical protein
MSAIKSVFKLLSPSFYRQQWKEYITDLSKEITAGRPQPFFKAILLIGVVGYTMEYTQVGSKILLLFFVDDKFNFFNFFLTQDTT